MRIKKYVAENMREAIAKIKEDLGPNALIISSRRVRKDKNMFGLFGKEMVEISASSDQPENTNIPESVMDNIETQAQRQNVVMGDDKPVTPPYNQDFNNVKSLRENVVAPLKVEIDEMRSMIDEVRNYARNQDMEERGLSNLRYDINELKGLINNYMEGGNSIPIKNLHRNLASVYQQLLINGMEEKFSRRLIEESMFKIQPQNIEDLQHVRLFIARMLVPLIKTKDFFEESSQHSSTRLCFIGPTGVGKTSTLAKIAGQTRELNDKAKIGIISFDNYRIGSVDLLRDYSKTIKAKFRSADSPAEFKKCYLDMMNMDYLYIDSPGTSQRDNEKLGILKDFLEEHSTIEKLLILDSSTKDVDLTEQTKKFGSLKVAGVVFAKLDETSVFGGIINHMIRFKLPLYFLTTGQKVPDDAEVATKERIIDLLMNFSADDYS